VSGGSISLSQSVPEVTIEIDALQDAFVEEEEAFDIYIDSIDGVPTELGAGATASIMDDDLSFSIPTDINEGEEGLLTGLTLAADYIVIEGLPTGQIELEVSPDPFEVPFSFPDDNPTCTTVDVYPITVRAHRYNGEWIEQTKNITVHNVAPTVTITSIEPDDSLLENGRVDEGEGFTIHGAIVDPGVNDTL
jgi:hypothetical protein